MELASLADALKKHRVLAGLSDAHLEFLAGCTKNVRFAKGEYLFREDQDCTQLYVLRKGKISLEIHHTGRGAVVYETLHMGELLGWSALSAPYRWHVDGRAVKDTLAFAIDGSCLRRKLDEDHSFGYAFTRLMLRTVQQRLVRARLQLSDCYKVGA